MSEKPMDDAEKGEPKENDKCMMENGEPVDKSEKKSRLDALGDRAKQFTSKRHNVVIVLLCIFAFILFIVVIALAVQLNAIDSSSHVGCASGDCLRAAASVVSFLNRTNSPCNDIWAYSCDGWISKNKRPGISVKDVAQENIYKELRHAIDVVSRSPENSWAVYDVKVKVFFTACMNLDDIEYDHDRELKNYINKLGGWKIMGSFTHRLERDELLQKMHAEFGVNPYFRIAVEPDDLMPNKNIIKLYPDGLGLPGPDYYFDAKYAKQAQAYKQFMRDVVMKLGATTDKASIFVDNMWNYEIRLARAMPPLPELKNKQKSYKKLTLQELPQIAPVVKWSRILQAFFPSTTIDESTPIAIISEGYFRNLSRVLSSTDDEIMNDYLMWRLASGYVEYLDMSYRTIYDEFRKKVDGAPSAYSTSETRYKYCLHLTSKYLGHALGSLYVKRIFPVETRHQVQEMLDRIKRVIDQKSGDIPWLSDSASLEQFRKKVRDVLTLIGYPNFVENENQLREYYSELNVKSHFIANIKDGVLFLHKKMDEKLKSPVSPDHSWTIYPQDVDAVYHTSGNSMAVGGGLLHYPFYETSYPLAMKYGSLGAILTSVLMRAFDDSGIAYQNQGKLQPWMSNRTMELYNKRKDCLYEQLDMTSYEGTKVNANLTVGEIIASIGGVKFAFEAYKNHISSTGEEENLITIKDNEELFFLSYVQSMCENQKPGNMQSLARLSTNLPNKIRVTTVLQQLPEFAHAFSCPRGSAMNLDVKCRMW